MKKSMVILCLLLVIGKMTYNVCSFINDSQDLAWERFFNIGMIFFIVYFSICGKNAKKATSA